MSHKLKQVPLQLTKKDSPETNKEQLTKVANKAFDSSDLIIKAAGTAAKIIAENLRLAINRKENALAEVTNSTTHLHEMNDDGVDGYAALVKVIFDETGENVEETRKYLVELSKDATTDGEKPGKAHGGSIVQSEKAGKGLMHYHPIKDTLFYKIWVSENPDSSVMSSYTRCDPDTFPNSHGGLVNVKTGIKLWFRIQACNAHGDGIMSDAFGGISFSATV